MTIAEAVKVTGQSRHTIKDHIKALANRGHLTLHGAGRGAWYGLHANSLLNGWKQQSRQVDRKPPEADKAAIGTQMGKTTRCVRSRRSSHHVARVRRQAPMSSFAGLVRLSRSACVMDCFGASAARRSRPMRSTSVQIARRASGTDCGRLPWPPGRRASRPSGCRRRSQGRGRLLSGFLIGRGCRDIILSGLVPRRLDSPPHGRLALLRRLAGIDRRRLCRAGSRRLHRLVGRLCGLGCRGVTVRAAVASAGAVAG